MSRAVAGGAGITLRSKQKLGSFLIESCTQIGHEVCLVMAYEIESMEIRGNLHADVVLHRRRLK